MPEVNFSQSLNLFVAGFKKASVLKQIKIKHKRPSPSGANGQDHFFEHKPGLHRCGFKSVIRFFEKFKAN